MNHRRPAAGRLRPPAVSGEKRSAARSTRLRRYVLERGSQSHLSCGASASQRSRSFSMFGRGRLAAREYFGRSCLSAEPSKAVTTLRSVVHSACGSIRISNVKPRSSSRAGAEAEISVARLNFSRSYTSRRRPSSTFAERLPFFSSASLTSNRSAKSQPASIRTFTSTGSSSWLRIVNCSEKSVPYRARESPTASR